MSTERLEKLENVYRCADQLMAYLGYHGEVSTQDSVADELLTALNEVDAVSPATHDIFLMETAKIEPPECHTSEIGEQV